MIFKRGRNWHVRIHRDGILYQSSTGTPNRNNALRIEAKLKEDINNAIFGISKTDPNVTFGKVWQRFSSSGSVRPFHRYHAKILLPFFADVPICRITQSVAEEFRRGRRIGNPNLKDASINRDLSVMRRIRHWAFDAGLIGSMPLAPLRLARERRTKRQVMSVEEERTLLKVAAPHMRMITIAALDTGMRRGELLHQRWEDIDLNQRLLWATKSKTPEGEFRAIPLTNRLFTLLSDLPRESALVFTYKAKSLQSLKTAWAGALRRAEVRHIRFHDLRHTFATRLVEAGVVQEIRMALMGHSAGSQVHGRYIHIDFPAKREAIQKLEQWTDRQTTFIKENNHANVQTGANPLAGVDGAQKTEQEDTTGIAPERS